MLEAVTFEWKNVEVDTFNGLLIDYARSQGASVIVRGIRAVSDYEYELQMAMMNRKIEPDIETVFMLPGEAYSFFSSRLVQGNRPARRPREGPRSPRSLPSACAPKSARIDRCPILNEKGRKMEPATGVKTEEVISDYPTASIASTNRPPWWCCRPRRR